MPKGNTAPRVYTPPLRELTPETSLGYAAVTFAKEVCGVDLIPWQEWLLIHALELHPSVTTADLATLPDLAPMFRFRRVIVLVARQNGKSTLAQVLALFFLYILGVKMVIGTAQSLDIAEEVWEGSQEMIEETPQLAKLARTPLRVNGNKTIRLISGGRYKVKAATRAAGRGLSGDLILMDELREHLKWDAWSAITKTTNARANAQIWGLSNAGDHTSVVLRYLRMKAHLALGDPDGINSNVDSSKLLPVEHLDEPGDESEDDVDTALFEWSAHPERDVMDREGWAEANPSMGYLITERVLRSDAADDPEWVFRTESLCQWPEVAIKGPFPDGAWEAGVWGPADPAEEVPQIVGKVRVGIDMSVDRSKLHVVFAGRDKDGRAQVELVASRAVSRQSDKIWLVDWLKQREHLIEGGIACQGRGAPVSALIPELEAEGLKIERWEGPELSAGTGRFYDAVRDNTFRHFAQPLLDAPASSAAVSTSSGGTMLIDRIKSPIDASPLVAAIAAHWMLTRAVEAPRVSVYETRRLVTV